MPYSISTIKNFASIDLDYFEVRGARAGFINARTTSPLYDRGPFDPIDTIITGSSTYTSGDTTVVGISFNAPYTGLNATMLVQGDTIVAGTETLSVLKAIDSTGVVVAQAPGSSGSSNTTFNLVDREYLIEPDKDNNTITGIAAFTNDSSVVTGLGFSALASGDSIQLNSYQKYFIVKTVDSPTKIELTTTFTGNDATGYYTAKRWRLNRLYYQYTKNNFTYNKNKARWLHDTTTASELTAYDYYTNLSDGIQIQFTPTLNPTSYPDLMDSNVVLNKTLSKSTGNDLFQFSLPAVPNPEESFSLYINDMKKDMFPYGNKDYVLHYGSSPLYEFPPPMDQRQIASVMFLKSVDNVTLSPFSTSTGIIQFRDAAGNPVPGLMPGSESIHFNGADQTAYRDYVLDVNTGLGYSSGQRTNEAVVKYVAYQPQGGLYDYGLDVTLNGVPQKLTIPRAADDDILFDLESGRLKPINSDNPGPGDEYIVNYMAETDFISDLQVNLSAGATAIQLTSYPIKNLSVILLRNDTVLNENIDYRVSYLTGRIILFTPAVAGDVFMINYSPLIKYKNGLTYENKIWYCKSYQIQTPVTGVNPPEFTLTNKAIKNVQILSAYNVTRSQAYDLTGYIFKNSVIHLQANTINTSFITATTDVVLIDYKFANTGVEHIPVEYIPYYVPEGQDFLAFIDRDCTSLMPAGTFIRLTNVDSAGDYFFKTISSAYDGFDTVVQLDGVIPVEITNPQIFLSDSGLSFQSISGTWTAVPSGATDFYLPGSDISRLFRTGEFLNLDTDYYYIKNSQYDTTKLQNVVSVNVPSYRDYTSASILTSVALSDCPLYYEGDTAISTAFDIITDPAAPVMSLNYPGLVSVTSDNSAFSVTTDQTQYSFAYSLYPNISSLATVLSGVGFNVQSFVSDWTSSKIVPMNSVTVTKDSTTPVSAIPALRFMGTDTTRFSVSGVNLVLTDPLIKTQRYSLDYLGLVPLGDTTVNFSASYFSILPKKSKVSASFKFDNLDQFYIQALGQRGFLETVSEPRIKDEALQQSGNVGQGGEIAGDDDQGNSSGGLAGLEYRRQDAEIECRIFNTVFDWFNVRMQNYGNEMYAAFGWRLCNNDGLLSLADEASGTKSLNRMFPWADYTNFPVYKIGCLSGETKPYGYPGPNQPPAIPTSRATFINGSAVVTSTPDYPTYFTKQLRAGDFIRPYKSTSDLKIQSVDSDTQVTLENNYSGTTATIPFIIASNFPLFDDDGHTGGKIIGTYTNFSVANNDTFDATVNGIGESYTFKDVTTFDLGLTPFPIPIPIPIVTVSTYDINTIVKTLNENFSRCFFTYQWIMDPNSVYGYKSVLVVRTKNGYNKITLGPGSAVSKFGFTPGSTAFGNMNNTDSDPEYPHTVAESTDLGIQISNLNTIVGLGIPNKLNRASPAGLACVGNINTAATDEVSHIPIEIARVTDEIAATSVILLEPSLPGYAQTLIAHNNDTTFLNDPVYGCTPALNYATSVSGYEGFSSPSKWVLDLIPGSQNVLGTDATGVAVPVSSGPGITPINGQNTFILQEDPNYNRRFLNATVASIPYAPVVTFIGGGVADGSWTNWNIYNYSNNNQITFHLNDTTGQFILDYSPSTYSYSTTTSSFTLTWDTTRSKTLNYASYPTVGSIKTALNTIAGINASGSSIYDGSSAYSIAVVGSIPLNAFVAKGPLPMFSMQPDSSLIYNYSVDNTALNLYWTQDSSAKSKIINFGTYSTVGAVRLQADSPGLATTALGNDSSGSTVLATAPLSPVGAGVYLFDKPYNMFTLTADGIYNITAYGDISGIGMSWDGGSRYYDYVTFSTVGSIKTGINNDVPGINATGPAAYDSSASGFKPFTLQPIPSDVTVYPALRPCTVNYDTIDDRIILTRLAYDTTRKNNYVDPRVTLLNSRQGQIRQHVIDEELIRANNGGTGNIYNWADNRFNRSNGCEARLTQILKQIEMNQSSLTVSRRFM